MNMRTIKLRKNIEKNFAQKKGLLRAPGTQPKEKKTGRVQRLYCKKVGENKFAPTKPKE